MPATTRGATAAPPDPDLDAVQPPDPPDPEDPVTTPGAVTPDGPPARRFEPGRYLTKVGGADYLEVKWRLVWLREAHPDAVVYTELVSHQGQDAIFRATVSIPDGGSATGFGSEAYDDFRDYVEKAETKALGRALAALGFGTQFCPDFEFGARDGRVVDTPVNLGSTRGQRLEAARGALADRQADHAANGGGDVTGSGTVTPKQVKFIQAIARELRISDEALSDEAERLYGSPIAELGRRDASSFIERLQARRASAPDQAVTR